MAALERRRFDLDAIVANKYRHNPAKRAAWESASHVERSPQRQTPAQT